MPSRKEVASKVQTKITVEQIRISKTKQSVIIFEFFYKGFIEFIRDYVSNSSNSTPNAWMSAFSAQVV